MEMSETRAALFGVLLDKIYPRYPELVRNDTQTARLLVSYVNALYEESKRTELIPIFEQTRPQIDISLLSYSIRPLVGLSEEAIRKNIRTLWQSGDLPKMLTFKEVKKY